MCTRVCVRESDPPESQCVPSQPLSQTQVYALLSGAWLHSPLTQGLLAHTVSANVYKEKRVTQQPVQTITLFSCSLGAPTVYATDEPSSSECAPWARNREVSSLHLWYGSEGPRAPGYVTGGSRPLGALIGYVTEGPLSSVPFGYETEEASSHGCAPWVFPLGTPPAGVTYVGFLKGNSTQVEGGGESQTPLPPHPDLAPNWSELRAADQDDDLQLCISWF